MDDISYCECNGPGYCVKRGREVTAMGWNICRAGNQRHIDMYFNSSPVDNYPRSKAKNRPCSYLGEAVLMNGKQALRDCLTCRGNVQLKVFSCLHPGHALDPTTTYKACERCPDYTTDLVQIASLGENLEMNHIRGG